MLSDFPRILTLLRKEKKISQKKAAEDLGVQQALLSHYENGKRECGLEFLLKAAEYYNVTTDYLLGKSDIPNRLQWLDSIDKSTDLEKLRADIAKEEQAEKMIVAQYGQDVWDALCMYIQLDAEDRAEVRGMMKGLYRHDKYSIQEGLKNA